MLFVGEMFLQDSIVSNMSGYSYKLLLLLHADTYTTDTVQVKVNQDNSPGHAVENHLCFKEHKRGFECLESLVWLGRLRSDVTDLRAS